MLDRLEESHNFSQLWQWLPGAVSRLFQQSGEMLIRRLRERVQAGQGADGERWAKYSPAWKAWREKHGLPAGHRSLFFTGGMLSAIRHRVEKDGLRLYFVSSPEEKKAQAHHEGRGRLPATHFFALSAQDVAWLRDQLEEALHGEQ